MIVAFGWEEQRHENGRDPKGASRLMATVCSAIPRSSTPDLRFSDFMMPALLMRTLRVGNCASTSAPRRFVSLRFSTSTVRRRMPGLARAASSRTDWRRPAMMTWLPPR